MFLFYEQIFDLEENRKWLKDDIIYIYKLEIRIFNNLWVEFVSF